MLLELRAENYAVIDRATIQLGSGLNLLTGETGAGKSILIDALALLLGGKASGDVVRHGADKAVIGCTFESTPGARAVLEANGIDAEEDEILLRREVTAAGKGRVFINNQAATVAALRQLAPELALVHSQGETMGAFDQAQQRLLLDRFGNISTDSVATAYTEWRETLDRLRELESSEQDRLRMADLWRFQCSEIRDAVISSDVEDRELEAEKRVLANAEKLFHAASAAHDLLYEAEQSAEASLGAALKHLEELARYDPRFVEPAQQLAAAKATVEDVDAEVRNFAQNIQASPGRLSEIEDRLAALDRLKRKYGSTLPEVIAFGAEAAAKLAEVENRDSLIAELRDLQLAQAQTYKEAAGALSRDRTSAAMLLQKQAEVQINDLAMRVRFNIRVGPQSQPELWSANGFDIIEFLIATNAGEPLKPLHEIASGGEMSRVPARPQGHRRRRCSKLRKVTRLSPRQPLRPAPHPCLRRDRYWHRWPRRRCGRPQAQNALHDPTGHLHHPSPTDCGLRRSPLPDREVGTPRTHGNICPPDGPRRARRGDSPHALGRHPHRNQPQACRAPAQYQHVNSREDTSLPAAGRIPCTYTKGA